MFGALGEWTPDTREVWRSTWSLKCLISTFSSSPQPGTGHSRPEIRPWCEGQNQKFHSSQSTKTSRLKSIQSSENHIWSEQLSHSWGLTVLQIPLYPWFVQGGWSLRYHSPLAMSTAIVWIWFFYTETDAWTFELVVFLTRFFLAQLLRPQPSPWDDIWCANYFSMSPW